MVYDFGGGTLDCTILELYQRSCNVKTISGDDHLGGQDLDVQILEFVINKWNNMEEREEDNLRITDDPKYKKVKAKLRVACAVAKE